MLTHKFRNNSPNNTGGSKRTCVAVSKEYGEVVEECSENGIANTSIQLRPNTRRRESEAGGVSAVLDLVSVPVQYSSVGVGGW